MPSSSLVRRVLTGCALFVTLALAPPAAQGQREATSADARLRALYTAEWNWRQEELARGGDQPGEAGASDRFPRVDAASQQARLAYWTRALATLDSHPVRPALARGEGQRAGLPHLDPRARQRREVPHLRGAVQQRHVLLDGVHAAPGLRDRRRLSRTTSARLRDVPRYFDEQIANMRAGLARGYTVPRVSVGRPRQDDRAVRQGRHDATRCTRRSRRCRRRFPRPTRRRCAPRRRPCIRDVVAPAYTKLLTMMRDRVPAEGAHDARPRRRCPTARRSTRR